MFSYRPLYFRWDSKGHGRVSPACDCWTIPLASVPSTTTHLQPSTTPRQSITTHNNHGCLLAPAAAGQTFDKSFASKQIQILGQVR